jgi:hypothetical protein
VHRQRREQQRVHDRVEHGVEVAPHARDAAGGARQAAVDVVEQRLELQQTAGHHQASGPPNGDEQRGRGAQGGVAPDDVLRVDAEARQPPTAAPPAVAATRSTTSVRGRGLAAAATSTAIDPRFLVVVVIVAAARISVRPRCARALRRSPTATVGAGHGPWTLLALATAARWRSGAARLAAAAAAGVARARPWALGHRGVRGSLPENTVAAFRGGARAPGSTGSRSTCSGPATPPGDVHDFDVAGTARRPTDLGDAARRRSGPGDPRRTARRSCARTRARC